MARRYPLSRATKELVSVLELLGMAQEEAADAGGDLCDALTGGMERFYARLDRVDSFSGVRLVIRWIPPIEVNGGGAAGAEAVHLGQGRGGGRAGAGRAC